MVAVLRECRGNNDTNEKRSCCGHGRTRRRNTQEEDTRSPGGDQAVYSEGNGDMNTASWVIRWASGGDWLVLADPSCLSGCWLADGQGKASERIDVWVTRWR